LGLHFTPPRTFELTTDTIPGRANTYRMLPVGVLYAAEWYAVLPDSARLEWIEPEAGVPGHGGVYASIGLRGDTLDGRAERFRDVITGNDPYAIMVATRVASCPSRQQ